MNFPRLAKVVSFALLAGHAVLTAELVAQGEPLSTAWIPFRSVRIAQRVNAEHPQVRAWAEEIAAKTSNPVARAALAESLVGERIRYTASSLVEGREQIPSVEQVLRAGQGNCEAQAIVLASLCRALGLKASIHSRADHAWASIETDSGLGQF